jgi:hypothetical protein
VQKERQPQQRGPTAAVEATTLAKCNQQEGC